MEKISVDETSEHLADREAVIFVCFGFFGTFCPKVIIKYRIKRKFSIRVDALEIFWFFSSLVRCVSGGRQREKIDRNLISAAAARIEIVDPLFSFEQIYI